MREWEFRRQRRWSFAAAILCVLVVLSFAAEFVYARAMNAPAPARMLVAQNNQVRIPLSDLTDSSLHFYTADVNNTVIRFLVIHQPNGDYATALDACEICGWSGYRQEGQNVVCRNCGATIYIPSIGEQRRLQSDCREIARGKRRSDRGSFGARRTPSRRFTPRQCSHASWENLLFAIRAANC